MPRFAVEAIHKETGQETTMVVDAPSSELASAYVNDMGFLVARVRQEGTAPTSSGVQPPPTARRKMPRVAYVATASLLVVIALTALFLTESGRRWVAKIGLGD